MTGLDDAGMDLQVAQLSSRTDKEVHSRTTLSWLDWQLPLFVTLCAIAGTILFTFLVSGNVSFLFTRRLKEMSYSCVCNATKQIFLDLVMAEETNVA